MKIEDQVLSIKQVRELQELGFDVGKYASMCWFEQTPFAPIEQSKKYELEILTYSLMGNRGYLEVIPTLTIGDIVDILPKEIDFKIGIIWFMSIQFLNNKHQVFYFYDKQIARVDSDKKQINALFEALKWVIKYKHIEL